MRRKKPVHTAVLNLLVPLKIREAIEDRADARGESLAEAARYFMELGIKHAEVASWREQDHDDLVLSVALAAWYGECPPKTVLTFSTIPVTRKYSEDYYYQRNFI